MSSHAADPSRTRTAVLVVDDRPDKLLALEAALSDLGPEIVKVQSGREALRQLLARDFAVILLDVNMPGMDGFETAAMIRQREANERTPIIFVSAVSDTETHVSRGYSLGAVDYIHTPVDREILRAKVGALVELYEKAEHVRRRAEEVRAREADEHRRRLAEARERLEAETRRNRFFTLALDMLAIARFDGRFQQVNPAWERTLGYDEAQLLACPMVELVHPEDRAAAATQWQHLIEGVSIVYFESRFLCQGGETRWVSWTAAPFVEEGLVYIFARDVTDRKRAEEERVQLALEQARRATAELAEKRAGFLADASGMLAASLDDHTILANLARLAVPRLADWCLVDMAGAREPQRLEAAHGGPVDPELAEQVRRSSATPGTPQAHVLRELAPVMVREVSEADLARLYEDAEQRQLLERLHVRSLMVVPLVVNGGPTGVLTFLSTRAARHYGVEDLSLAEELARRVALAVQSALLYKASQEARQAAETANRAKDEFLATLSHELRTPLNPILGWTRLLRTGSLDREATAKALEVIERNVRAQARLIEDLLDVSRIVTGKLRLQPQPIDLCAVVEAGVDAVRPTAEAREITLSVSLDPEASPLVGDAARLQQVVWNLVSNAVKFSPRGGRVEVALARRGELARLSVRDNGHGIPPDFLPHVFERFRQADGGSARRHGGLGLGLAIVRELVDLHGGTVSADSEGEGKGSVFTVELPLQAAPPARPAPAQAAPRLQGVRALVLAADEGRAATLRDALGRFGAEVKVVAGREEAVEALRARPDVLVADLDLLQEGAATFIRTVRGLEAPQGGRTPAAAVGALEDADLRGLLAAGFQAHVRDAGEPGELAATVAALARGTA